MAESSDRSAAREDFLTGKQSCLASTKLRVDVIGLERLRFGQRGQTHRAHANTTAQAGRASRPQ